MKDEQLTIAASALAQISPTLRSPVELEESELIVGTRRITLPSDWVNPPRRAGEDPFLSIDYALPSRAHGDAREKLLFGIVQDAYLHDGTPTGLPAELDVRLKTALAGDLPLAEQDRPTVAAAMGDAYWTTPKELAYLVPYHALLPTSYRQTTISRATGQPRAARYKLFRGVILLFLSWTGSEVDTDLVQSVLDVLNDKSGFTLLDNLLLETAQAAGAAGGDATVEALTDRFRDFTDSVARGVFCQPSLTRFQEDLRCVLEVEGLPRRDRLDLLTALLSLHLAVYYYRLSLVLGEELDRAIAATGEIDAEALQHGCDCAEGLAECTLAGRLRFRVGTSGDRPVSLHHGCAVSYREIDTQRLFPLAATIITTNIAEHILSAFGADPGVRPMRAAAELAAGDSTFADDLDSACAAFSVLYAVEKELATSADDAAGFARSPGIFALREAVLAAWRPKLKYWSRDVVNSLAKREAGSLIRTRGRVTFFELDEDFLYLLVRLVCGAGQKPFDEFLKGLRLYGLAPQDDDETARLIDALEHLGMLRRYSDAGESIYVSHNA